MELDIITCTHFAHEAGALSAKEHRMRTRTRLISITIGALMLGTLGAAPTATADPYGFPRKGDPGRTLLIHNYIGTRHQAEVLVNDATGDIATIYTSVSNDWTRWVNTL